MSVNIDVDMINQNNITEEKSNKIIDEYDDIMDPNIIHQMLDNLLKDDNITDMYNDIINLEPSFKEQSYNKSKINNYNSRYNYELSDTQMEHLKHNKKYISIYVVEESRIVVNNVAKILSEFTALKNALNNFQTYAITNILVTNVYTSKLCSYIASEHQNLDKSKRIRETNILAEADLIIGTTMIFFYAKKFIVDVYINIFDNYTQLYADNIYSYNKSYFINLIAQEYDIFPGVVDLFINAVHNLESRKNEIENFNLIISELNHFEITTEMKEFKRFLNLKRFNSIKLIYSMCIQYKGTENINIEFAKIKTSMELESLLNTPLFFGLLK